MIAFLGMGHLGANFVKAMLDKGRKVNVWNRTPAKATDLEADGAKAFANIADAVNGATHIHLTLKDDAAVDEVLEQASAGFSAGAIILDHTTTSTAGAAKRAEYWKKRGFAYLHAPVFMGPQNARESTGSMLVSGDQQLIEEVTPLLAAMTGKVLNFGTDPSKAAGLKLIGNLLLIAMTGGLSDALSLAGATGVTVEDMAKLFETFNPGNTLQARLKKMTSDTFDQPTWELNMARKDAGLMMKEVSGKPPMVIVPPVAAVMDKWIANGHGHQDWTVIAKDSL
ncbi:NAD(P)-dependent oxidoreductase [Flavipsychrobacter stenotrophus]|uniref:NAD(P)-dependent oxidoreductase n=1 Tax=Flavipsychrobacter stenotrophus TaxID=2077091 RepID=A0A2S7SUA5_9BACT|nr:NAD(P)-dependent oxidoreductase [Flavipsychrobacter stenotrophus]PQJ10308.1 NAD(P)-dependent oxidoreductase [Flavipsychrobacter stenotrophus]